MAALLIPFFRLKPYTKDLPGDLPEWIDPLVIDPWQMLVIVAFFVGVWTLQNRARDWGLSMKDATDLAFATIIGAVFGAHWFHVFLYDWDEHRGQALWPLIKEILNPFYGWSSFGGFVGAAVGLIAFARWRRIQVAQYGDAAICGIAYGWIFGRLGCFSVHDHIGKITTSPLGMDFPVGAGYGAADGTRRWELGGIEVVLTCTIALFAWWAFKKNREKWRWGSAIVWVTVAYTIPRFFMDYLRAEDLFRSDPRYFGFTPGQWSAIGMCVAALAYWALVVRFNDYPTKPGGSSQPQEDPDDSEE